MHITIDVHSGFCSGVINAIKTAEEWLQKEGTLYCLGDIVHNSEELQRLVLMGLKVITYDEFRQLHGVRVLIRAHGEPPETYRIAQENGIEILDATCKVVLNLQKTIKQEFESDRNDSPLMSGRILRFEKTNEHRQQLIFMVTPLDQLPFYIVHVSQHNKIAASIDNNASTVLGVVALFVFVLIALAAIASHLLFRRYVQRDLNDSVNSSTLFDTLLWKGDNFTIILTNENFDILHASAYVVDSLNNGEDMKEESLFKFFPSDAFKKFAHRVAMGGQMLASERKTIVRVQKAKSFTSPSYGLPCRLMIP